jgi:hypothetical protein
MSLFNRNKQTYSVQYNLSDNEYVTAVKIAVQNIIDKTAPFPYYAMRSLITNRVIVKAYTDLDIDDLDDTYDVIKDIETRIDRDQYYQLKDDIYEGVQHELSKQTSVFGNVEESVEKLNELVDNHGLDTIQNLIKIGLQNEAVETAQEEYKEEQKAKKKKEKPIK